MPILFCGCIWVRLRTHLLLDLFTVFLYLDFGGVEAWFEFKVELELQSDGYKPKKAEYHKEDRQVLGEIVKEHRADAACTIAEEIMNERIIR